MERVSARLRGAVLAVRLFRNTILLLILQAEFLTLLQ
jgi:hypothetical protein